MTPQIHELQESLKYMIPITSHDTKNFIGEGVEDIAASTTAKVYFFKSPTLNSSVPKNFKSLDEVVKRHEAIPSRAAAMVRARKKIASLLAEDKALTTLAELRLRAGFSQAKLAEALGNSQPSYSLIELGRHDIMLATFEKLVSLLSISRDELAEAMKNTKNGVKQK